MSKKDTPLLGATPIANLLPEKLRQRREIERAFPRFLIAIAASLVLAAVMWVVGSVPVTLAQTELNAVNAQSDEINDEISSLGDAQALLNAVGTRESDRARVTTDEVLFGDLQDQIASVLPAGGSLVTFSAAIPGLAASMPESTCLGTGAQVSLKMLVAGSEGALARAADFLAGLEGLTGYECGVLVATNLVGSEETVGTEVEMILGFTEQVRANRFETEVLS